MRRLSYDIWEKPDDKTFVWVQAERDLDSAVARVKELESTVGGKYVVFDHNTLKRVCIRRAVKKDN